MSLRTVVLALALTSTAHAAPRGISVFESRDRAQTTEGVAILDTDPDTAYATATDYRNWSRIFPELREAIVNKRVRDFVEVTFVHRDGSVDHLRFRNRPDARIVAFEQIGGDAEVWAQIAFAPGELVGTTRVHTRLHADVKGLAAAFVDGSELRARRQQHVRDDLGRLCAYFATRQRAASNTR